MSSLQPSLSRPRVLRVDLTRLVRTCGASGAALAEYADPDPSIERVGRAGGSALGHALVYRALADDPGTPCPLVFAVGESVRAALPTAARTSVISVAPLHRTLAEGQVGGAFARALASVADALVLSGTTSAGGAILVIRADGSAECMIDATLVGASPRTVGLALAARFGTRAALAIGAAGEADVPFASVAALEEPPSFVGRGGLGAVFGALGLKAVVVLAAPVEPDPARVTLDRELQRALLRSPRLRARAAGGTLELAALSAARAGPAAPAARIEDLAAQSVIKKGCAGCPTPCGLVFERVHPGGATRHLGRFGALSRLAEPLGLSIDDARALLERCDELALDAKETGHVLARGGHVADVAEAQARIDDIVAQAGSRRNANAPVRGGPGSTAPHTVLERTEPLELAVRLAAAVSPPGSDPMRTFPFLAVDAASRERLVAALDGLPLPAGAEDPFAPAGKGRIVWWHENLVAALDATGFCAFSAAGLLSDGVCSVAELARWIAPPSIARSTDRAHDLLALGAAVALLKRATRTFCPERAKTAAIPDDLRHPELWPEYARLRGLAPDGTILPRALALLGDTALLDVGRELEREPRRALHNLAETSGEPLRAEHRPGALAGESHDAPQGADGRRDMTRDRVVRITPGRITITCGGPLRTALAGQEELARELPARLDVCLKDLADRIPRAAEWLIQDGRTVPQAWRNGRRLEPSDMLRDGDHVDLVIAVGGG